MIAIADQHGEVNASIPGLARVAGVSVASCEEALATFLAPDTYSRTRDDEGRRIEVVDGGWWIINHSKYRELATGEAREITNAARQKRYRDKKNRNAPVTEALRTVTRYALTTPICQAEAEAEAEAEASKAKNNTIAARQLAESVYEAYPRKVGRPVALRAIEKALTTTDHETLLKATVAYAEARRGQDQQFTPMPATWFNQQRYLDEPSTWTNSPAIKPKERNERTEHLTLTIDR